MSGSNISRFRGLPARFSGGESQRIRLASQIAPGLTAVLCAGRALPSGCNQRDNARLLRNPEKAARSRQHRHRRSEHDEDAIREADYVVDMARRRCPCGVSWRKHAEEVMRSPKSLTGNISSASARSPFRRRRAWPNSRPMLRNPGRKAP